MTVRVQVYGAGSIGNHLTHGCRRKGWPVTVLDRDPAALTRMRESIYPSRYGAWDPGIELLTADQDPGPADLVIIGTPPDSHLPLTFRALERTRPRVICVEKPLCTPDLSECDRLDRMARETGTIVLVGYNHTLVPATVAAAQAARNGTLGTPETMVAEFREHWGGIFAAHPWLAGPGDSYLGSWQQGGGASGEHSHAINIWQHFAGVLGIGRITEVTATLDYLEEGGRAYDRLCQILVRTEQGFVGSIVQDVVTRPSQKRVRVQGNRGFVEWQVNFQKDEDRVTFGGGDGAPPTTQPFPKTRPDDFKGEIDHIDRLLQRQEDPDQSPIHLHRGLETMLVITAAHRSARSRRTVAIDYRRGWTEAALQDSGG